MTYTYLGQGALGSMVSSLSDVGSLATGIQYDAAGRMTQYSRGDGKAVSYSYNSWTTAPDPGKLNRYQVTSLYDISYDYDAAGNITSLVDAAGSATTYNYDDLARLTAADATGSSNSSYRYAQGYSFDSDGRLSTVSQTAPTAYTRTYTYHATRKHAVTAVSGGWSFSYDANGNMTSRNVGTAQTLGYDALNRLVSVNAPGAVSYLYDGDDQRVKEAYSTTTRYYVGPHMELQVSGTTKIFRSYYRLGDKLLGMQVAGQNAPAAEVGVWYFKIDHLGGVAGSRRASDGSAGLTFYYPYGDTLFTTDTNANSEYRYTGQRRDTVSKIGSTSIGLYFYGSRYFDPLLGRFVSPDSIIPEASQGVQAWDRYAGINNNPVRWNDPTGHDVGCAGEDKGLCSKGLTKPGFNLTDPAYIDAMVKYRKYNLLRNYTLVQDPLTGTYSFQSTCIKPAVNSNQQYRAQPFPTSPNQPSPIPFNIEITPSQASLFFNGVSHSTTVVPALVKGINAAVELNPATMGIGMVTSGFGQYYVDYNSGYSQSQIIGRALVVGIESFPITLGAVGFGYIGGLAGASIAPPTGVGQIVGAGGGFVAGYSTSYVVMQNLATNHINPQIFYPLFP